MSHLDDLISSLCPNGVESKRLDEIAVLFRGRSLAKKDIGTGEVPIILYGELYTKYGDYVSEVFSKASPDRAVLGTALQRGDILMPVTSTTKDAAIGRAAALLANEPVYLGGDAIALRHSQEPGYLVHVLNSSRFEAQKMKHRSGTTVSHLSPGGVMGLEIPLPPPEIQRMIVQILDQFSALEEGLETELEARRIQYQHYLDELLSFQSLGEVTWKSLGSLCSVKAGPNITKDAIASKPGIYPVINSGAEPLGYFAEFNTENDPIGIASRGSVGLVTWTPGRFFRGNLNYGVTIKDLNALDQRFLYHYLLRSKLEINQLCTFQGIPALNKSNLEKLPVPIPQIDNQRSIARSLDQFTELVELLEAEQIIRRMQFRYFRDKVLNFPEAVM